MKEEASIENMMKRTMNREVTNADRKGYFECRST
jgi:hypothetical protein